MKWNMVQTAFRRIRTGRRIGMRRYLEIGKIVALHGFRGVVKAEPWCDSPAVLAGMKRLFFPPEKTGDPYREVRVLRASVQRDRVLLTLEDVDSEEKAERLKNRVIYADRDDIPVAEGSFLIDDLKGLPVYDARDGRRYGVLRDVLQAAAGELYEIETETGTVLLPAVAEYVHHVDLTDGIAITPIKGFFDED